MNIQSTSSGRSFLAVAVSFLALACASTPGAKPEDMSAKSHEEAAAQETAKAERHTAKYDPNAPTGIAAEVAAGSDFGFEGADFNPTEVHNTQAKKHRKHSDAHLAAAAELRRAEDEACESIAPESRSWCPLLGPVVATENTSNGVRISVREGTNVDAMVARIRCHIAFGNTEGREGMDRCPLYVQGVQVQQVGLNSIELSTKGKSSIRELQRRVADHVGE